MYIHTYDFSYKSPNFNMNLIIYINYYYLNYGFKTLILCLQEQQLSIY